ncbi:MAG: hypothetical protein JWN37_420 [Candidatus Nomurabacteria bacterium]|nr:hypothetical protein [Candidatus Nomurabacteria bacterium]
MKRIKNRQHVSDDKEFIANYCVHRNSLQFPVISFQGKRKPASRRVIFYYSPPGGAICRKGHLVPGGSICTEGIADRRRNTLALDMFLQLHLFAWGGSPPSARCCPSAMRIPPSGMPRSCTVRVAVVRKRPRQNPRKEAMPPYRLS